MNARQGSYRYHVITLAAKAILFRITATKLKIRRERYDFYDRVYNRVVSTEIEVASCISGGIENSGLAILRRKEAYDE
jgi:hypothetical protein